MDRFWNALGMGANSNVMKPEPEPEPKPKTKRYGQSAETHARRRPKPAQNDGSLIGSISEMPPPPPRNFEGSRNNNRPPFQDSLAARMPKSEKEAERIIKEAKKEVEKEAERIRKEAKKEVEKEAEKDSERIRKEAEKERSSRTSYSEPKPAYNFSSFRNAYTSSHSFKPSDYAYSSNSIPSASRMSGVTAQTSRLLEIIGLNQATTEVTPKNINKAYKKMALKMHPDKNKDDPNATENFQNFQTAYEKLKEKYQMSGGCSKKRKSQKRRRTNKKR